MIKEEIERLAETLINNNEFKKLVSRAVSGRLVAEKVWDRWKEDFTSSIIAAKKEKEAEVKSEMASWIKNHLMAQMEVWKTRVIKDIENILKNNVEGLVREAIVSEVRQMVKAKFNDMRVSVRLGDLFDDD